MVRLESRTARNPGPRPPTQLLIITAIRNSNHGAVSETNCKRSDATNAAKTNKTAVPYLKSAGAIRPVKVPELDMPSLHSWNIYPYVAHATVRSRAILDDDTLSRSTLLTVSNQVLRLKGSK